ncbi:MAG: AI-2E family transporter, partial [Gammaproteobacteria bacterium]|nr:AI-2E family transporter [Gammaproteobacteria bacterium]
MIKLIKDWYEDNFTDPNQVSLALVLIFSIIVTYILVQTIAPILVAIVLAYMLEGLVQHLMKITKATRHFSVIVVFFLFLIISILTLFMLLPLLLDQLTLLVKSLPEIFNKSKQLILGLYDENEYIPKDYIDNIFLGLQGETSKVGNSIFTFSLASAGGLFAIIVYAILVPIMIFFMLFDKETINSWIARFFPKKLELTRRAYSELNLKIGNYIRCKFIEIMIVWISSFILFFALGLNYSLLLSFLCGLSVIIPYVGMIAVTIPIILVAYFQWALGSEFWYVIIGHLLIQAVDGNVVVPIMFSDAVNIHP